MARGRPRTLPSSLPRLSPEVVLDPELVHVNLQSRQVIVREELSRKRCQNQAQVAQEHARQRSKRQNEELTMAYEHAQLAAKKTIHRMDRLAQQKSEQQRTLDQLRLAVEGGEHEVTPREERQLRNLTGFGTKKPRLTAADHEVIVELAGSQSQESIARRHQSRTPNTDVRCFTAFGTLYFEIVEGSVTGEICLAFMKEMMAAYVRKGLPSRKRAFIMDNASIHHRDNATGYMLGSAVARKIGLEFLPIYSLFLNPLEEVFGLLNASYSNDDIRQYYFHVKHFLKFSEDRTPVFTQQLYESSHAGDEAGLCPMLAESVEKLLDSYLPHCYDEFTPEVNATLEHLYGCRRLTMNMIDAIVAGDVMGTSESEFRC
ncbi:hypothetical protein BBJ28_00023844 [Nothophytophthora sp. Chile5]|nr:hypothetical protein BBJ28_00023844 [Nothophytophthora sp. Chile5]